MRKKISSEIKARVAIEAVRGMKVYLTSLGYIISRERVARYYKRNAPYGNLSQAPRNNL